MAKITEIRTMEIEALRPYIQRALKLEEWPDSDWLVVEIIFDQVCINVSRAPAPPNGFSVVVTGKSIAHGIGTGSDVNPVTAIFRAYLTWRSYLEYPNQ